MGDFLRQAKIIKKIYIIVFLLFLILFQLFFVSIFSDQVLSPSKAYEAITLKQEILPEDPIKKASDIEKSILERGMSLKNSSYRIMIGLEDEGVEEKKNGKNIFISSVATFGGEAAYPNSRIILEIDSEKFFVSTFTDSKGNWSWTNNSHPLKEGSHTIKIYNISPFEISGVKDIFFQEYSFNVKEGLLEKNRSILNLNSVSERKRSEEEKDLLKDILDNNTSGVYFFDTALLDDKKSYLKGDILRLQIIIQELKEGEENNGVIKYEIFKDDGLEGVKVSEFEDEVILGSNNSFLKKIDLKNRTSSSSYFIKTTLETSGRKYISINDFNINSEEILKIRGSAVTREDITRVLLNSLALIIAAVIIILLVMIFEFKRFKSQSPIDRNSLVDKGYINN